MGSSGERIFAKRQTCRGKPIELSELGNGEIVHSEGAPGMTAEHIFEPRVGIGESASFEPEGAKGVPDQETRETVDSKLRQRKESERKDKEGFQLQEGWGSFQSRRSAKSGAKPLAAIAASNNGLNNKEHMSHSEGRGSIGAGDSKGCSRSGSTEGVLTEDTAALRIESCWRGFLGRCAVKHKLRSVLLDALRKIGGGRVSKVRRRERSRQLTAVVHAHFLTFGVIPR